MELTKTEQTTDDLKRIYWACNPNLVFTRKETNDLVTIRGFRPQEDQFDVLVDYVNGDWKGYRDYLSELKPHLKSFSKLSDEDAIFIGSIVDETESWEVIYRDNVDITLNSESYLSYIGLDGTRITVEDKSDSNIEMVLVLESYIRIIDFLRSQGYNLDFELNEFVQL